MKILVLVFSFISFTFSNPAANTEIWHWEPLMPVVDPFAPFPDAKTLEGVPDYAPLDRPMKSQKKWKAENCGPVLPSAKIINGQEAAPHSYPWQVALFINDMYFCGGSLISDEWILTAGHCTVLADYVDVVLGAHNISANEPSQVTIRSNGSDIITHEGYNQLLLRNDVGLIHLSSPVAFTAEIQPICLPSYSDEVIGGGVELTASGWGLTSDEDNATLSDTLNEVTNPSLNNTQCERLFSIVITNGTLCTDTREHHAGTCSGDSGGPLYKVIDGKTYSRGITSFGVSIGCASGFPNGFSRTKYFLGWIEENTGIIIDP